jgi:hypothetical protein
VDDCKDSRVQFTVATGSYILDQVAKTPVGEIHLFDGDIFGSHNAFRAPGATSLEDINAKKAKTEYFLGMYDPMRRGIFSHPYFLDQSNVAELVGYDFVFLCVDRGAARAILVSYLINNKIAFVDAGMNLQLVAATNSLVGTCRATLVPGIRHLRDLPGLPPPSWLGIYDDSGRLMVGINYNQDVGDSWEHSDTPGYPQPMTAQGYRFGVNYITYAMTH